MSRGKSRLLSALVCLLRIRHLQFATSAFDLVRPATMNRGTVLLVWGKGIFGASTYLLDYYHAHVIASRTVVLNRGKSRNF